MLTILSVLLFLLSFIHFCLAVTLMGECLASALNIKKDENFNDKWLHTSVSVLIPAHNEEKVISQTLKTIIPQLKSTDNIIVIADNCTDCTVAVVENMGVKIIERQNDLLKGKGYALDFGVNYLRENPPDVVIFIDADCNVEQNAIAFLVKNIDEQKTCTSIISNGKTNATLWKRSNIRFCFQGKKFSSPFRFI